MNQQSELQKSASQQPEVAVWKEIVAKYQRSSTPRALWQVINTFVPYALLWVLMYHTIQISWWLTAPLAVLAGGFLVRVFIIFHDCGHGSFLTNQKANNLLGFISGILTFTPFFHWRWEHAIHHASAGDLDRRGTGDVWTMTVEEYLQSSRWKRFSYRLTRNPFILFVVAPLYLFLIHQRFAAGKANKRERHSVYSMNVAIFLMALLMTSVFGLKAYLIIQLIAIAVAGTAGVWLFYVQHQFEGVYWERQENWDYTTAALQGSSFYKLPKVLQWFSGNIGYHHLHHLSSRIPNYNLQKCHEAHPLFQGVKPVTLLSSLKSFSFRLWDERERKLVGFSHLRNFRRTV
jgi:omega-6 fatty acid desaturase (delta-12 desaturase)